ncbi:1984_t:CDS:2 [Acaulospora morrowiae]|uniref:1984_t:CDS:1 n=1 Tax=Acaulospora morrowiae TaxID=94023 RepID=A0A9N8WQH0_9GLOM|nr:1984_t:CDS:2 [Acaulospora morrowiae]
MGEENNKSTPHFSLKSRFSFIFTKEFLKITVLGQFLSLCITATVMTSEELTNRNANIPITQSTFTYIFLFIICTPITLCRLGVKGYFDMLKDNGWIYLLLAIFNVEGNFFAVMSYQYTSNLSIILLDVWTIPVVVTLSLIFLKVKYHWSQYLGIVICLSGVGILIKGDFDSGKDMITGDIICMVGSTLYGISNIIEEYLTRKRSYHEIIGQLGFWGTIISIIQLSILERHQLVSTTWDGTIVGLYIVYNFAMICLYTVSLYLLRIASATYFNLSLLTSDFYSLILSICLFKTAMVPFYPIAFVCITLGLITYYVYSSAGPNEGDSENFTESDENDVEKNFKPQDVVSTEEYSKNSLEDKIIFLELK